MSTDRKRVLDAEVMVKGVGPELDGEIGTMEHSAESISNGKISTFDGTALIRRVGTGGVDAIAKLTEELLDLGIAIKFPSLIHVYVLVGATWSIISEKLSEP